MKANTHPTYYPKATVTCACGNSFNVGSTVQDMRVEICSACHPFFTGKQKLMDSAGRVDRFKRRAERSQSVTGRKLKTKANAS
ncbi:MAG: 50S ribosomal protein L31 [Candidatus Veblenbacteria bacterium]|nr:50S ribosomal protein L31 [Candidatus Veblenbacteria bacterium]